MDNDERDPRADEPSRDASTPDEESTAPTAEPPADEPAPAGDQAAEAGPPAPVEPPAAEEPVTQWPTAAPEPGDEHSGDELSGDGSAGAEQPTTPWPTTPPEIGEERPGGWPTEAPERGEVVLPPSADAEPAAAEDEFETAPWPTQDEPPQEQSQQAEPSWPQRDSADAAPAQPPAEAAEPPLPPPSEVEAYAPPPIAPEPAQPAHSVPATQPGESTRCPRCGTENRPGLAFCSNCGQRLVAAGAPMTVERPAAPEGTQACPRCGTHNRAGVAFCQNCGANLRSTAVVPGAGYVPPAMEPVAATTSRSEAAPRGGALLGPIVLLIAAIGMATAWLLPFASSDSSLWDRAYGAPGGYGIAFWNGYGQLTDLPAQAYFGFAAPVPILVLLLVALAVAGFLRARPGVLQVIGLLVVLAWSIALGGLFVATEVLGGTGGDLIQLLADLSPAGIIFLLSGLIAVIGVLTRFGRG